MLLSFSLAHLCGCECTLCENYKKMCLAKNDEEYADCTHYGDDACWINSIRMCARGCEDEMSPPM